MVSMPVVGMAGVCSGLNMPARVQIVGNNVRTASGQPLRGDHMLITTGFRNYITSDAVWDEMRNRYRLNAVRLVAYQVNNNPAGYTCNTSTQCMTVDRVIPILDDLVKKAAQKGMYAIIDYHTIGVNYNAAAALAWWRVIAPRYADCTHLLYEAVNETVLNPVTYTKRANTAQQKREDQEDLYTLMRAHAPQTHLIMWTVAQLRGSRDFPQDYDLMYDQVRESDVRAGGRINYSNASVGFHAYGYRQLGKIHDYSSAVRLRQTYPIIMTEMERTSDWGYRTHFDPEIRELESN